VIRIRRSRVLEDGKLAFDKIGHNIKDRIVVRYVNDFGEEEAGIDAGGLFKDFLTDLSARVFDPSFGLFIETSNKHTYPNPAATKIYDSYELDSLYTFLGRVLGKALFENIVIQPQFTHFFLAFMHGRYNFMNLINDLGTMDPELYKNLLFLKSYDGDISDLELFFSVTDTSFGSQTEVDLIPGGQRRPVTAGNKHRYIQCVAKYYLHDRILKQAAGI
jgi:ubiquitin-protein ligase E3 C